MERVYLKLSPENVVTIWLIGFIGFLLMNFIMGAIPGLNSDE